MIQMSFSHQKQFLVQNRLPITAGLTSGAVGLVVSFTGRRLALGRAWGDPLPGMLAAGQLLRNPFYFNWRGVIIHLVFAAMLGVFTAVLLVWRAGDSRSAATRASQIAAIINMGAVAVTEVDAPIVAMWYLIGGYLSVIFTTLAGQTAVSLINRFRKQHDVGSES